MGKKRGRFRADFRKNRATHTRLTDWTREFRRDDRGLDDVAQEERIGKNASSRRRTVLGEEVDSQGEPGFELQPAIDEAHCLRGRVLGVFGVTNEVQGEDGQVYQCATRRLLKTLSTEQRHVVAAGDQVWFRPAGAAGIREGIIERVEPRHGSICRTTRGRLQILVTNVDQAILVSSAAEPRIKPNLIDRMLLSAEKGRVRPILCINKIDLVEPADLEPLVGTFSRMGYEVLLLSAVTGQGIDRLRRRLEGRESVVVGQSGVGKSSLLNAVDDKLDLKVAAVSAENEKGRHTTSTARLLPLSFGGYVVDTPGVRQFQLWDVVAEEVAGFFRDLRPYVSLCRFPNCTHTHEADCAIKNAVADGRLDERRYESYCHLREDETQEQSTG